MKKQIKKLHLGKKTISNLSESELKTKIGGGETKRECSGNFCSNPTACGHTCDHCNTKRTCYYFCTYGC